MLYGRTTTSSLSRFIRDIPEELVEGRVRPQPRPARDGGSERLRYDDLPFSEAPRYSGNRQQATGNRPWGGGSPAGAGKTGFRPYTGSSAGADAHVGPSAAPPPDYRVGDTVLHKAFGRGMILSVRKAGNDALLEVAFDEKGTRKLMANTAAAFMKKL